MKLAHVDHGEERVLLGICKTPGNTFFTVYEDSDPDIVFLYKYCEKLNADKQRLQRKLDQHMLDSIPKPRTFWQIFFGLRP